jgi:hypothetical protein
MPDINADDGGLLVFGACNRSAARIPLVNRTARECEEKQKKGNNNKKKHEPDQENHGPPPFLPELCPFVEILSVIPVTISGE